MVQSPTASVFTLSAATRDVRSVRQLIERHALIMHFQPIVELGDGAIYGHEALVRTPEGAPWATPDALFAAARRENCQLQLELACLYAALREWKHLGASGKLFLNLSAQALQYAAGDAQLHALLDPDQHQGIAPGTVVLELTEHERVSDIEALSTAAMQLRRRGLTLALDDFGDGRSSLRLWSELKPEIVKIDKYFAQGLPQHGDKVQTLRGLIQIAEIFGSILIAEGIETAEELKLLRDLGLPLGQGWLLGRPAAQPHTQLPEPARAVLRCPDISVFPARKRAGNHGRTAAHLLVPAPALDASATHNDAYRLFKAHEHLHGLALVDAAEQPVALVSRKQFIDQYAQPYFREVFGRRPVLQHASLQPLQVDLHTGLEELTSILTSHDQRYLVEGFVITEAGRYRGLGTGADLVRKVTEARIEAARHANPLTFLPGNIPITEHICRLLDSGRSFVACYADLNHFKPYNDKHGYWRGDEMIRLVAKQVLAHADAQRDFVGHVGGDDFVVLFQSPDWLQRSQRIVEGFNTQARELFDSPTWAAGGFVAEDRDGHSRFHPCTTLCIGAVRIEPGVYSHPEDVANLSARAKQGAKQARVAVYELNADEHTPAQRSARSGARVTRTGLIQAVTQ